MNVKMIVAAAVSSVLLASFAYAATSTKLVDDTMPLSSGAMSGTNNMSGNVGGMSGTNSMSGNGMSGSTNNMSGNGMSGSSNNSSDSSADTATGDNDY